jgi:hypothetical protein
MRSVFIATPSYHTPVTQYYASMLATISELELAGYLVRWREWEQCCYVHTARNKLCSEFLFSGCDNLLFIDNDLGWNAKDIVRLCARPEPIVGAAAPFRHGTAGFPTMVIDSATEGELLKVLVLPTAIMKIKRQVLMALARAGFAPLRIEYNHANEELGRYRSFFDFEADEERHVEYGEDVAFCRKWQRLGGDLWVDPDFTISHFGADFRTGNLREHLRATRAPDRLREQSGEEVVVAGAPGVVAAHDARPQPEARS